MRTICFCNSNIPWGGGEKWHLEAARSLSGRGWRVLFLCHPRGELIKRVEKLGRVTVLPLPIGRLSFLNPLLHLRLTALFRCERPDALIMNLPSDLKAIGPAARSAGVRHIVYRRGSALPVRDTPLNRKLYGRVITRLIVNSEATRRMALVNNPRLIPEDRITILPNGFDVRAFDAALAAVAPKEIAALEDTPREKGSAGSPDNNGSSSRRAFVLGNAGRLSMQKGQHLLLHLCRRVLDRGQDCRVLIAGEGEREEELRALALSLRLEDKVFFQGFMTDLAPFWRAIDLFVLTSLWEGFGNVLIEAMLAEKPVFAFDVSNIAELVTDGLNGRLFPLPEEERGNCPDSAPRPVGLPGDSPRAACASRSDSPRTSCAPLDMMAEVVCALAAAPGEQQRMGRAGRSFALRFTQDACMDILEKLLEE